MSINETMKPLLYALADAAAVDFVPGASGANAFAGSRKGIIELFEGYSPTIISSIENSLYDPGNRVAAIDQHIFGNVGAITIVEGQQSTVHCFVYDRSKRPDNTNCTPWDNFWSRKRLYFWLEDCCKAIYHRSIFSEDWEELPKARERLKSYNEDRDAGRGSKKSYTRMWEA